MKKKLKNLKYTLRASVIRILLQCCRFLRGHCYCKNEFYYETVKVKIGEIKNTLHINKYEKFDMEELLEKKYTTSMERYSKLGGINEGY